MKTVLLVDDEYAIVEVLGALLEEEGYRVVAAANGEEGLARLAEGRPDVVILDVMMPRMGGREMLRALRADPAYAELPVVLMSAAPEALRAAAASHCLALLRKPFTLDELLAAMGRIARK